VDNSDWVSFHGWVDSVTRGGRNSQRFFKMSRSARRVQLVLQFTTGPLATWPRTGLSNCSLFQRYSRLVLFRPNRRQRNWPMASAASARLTLESSQTSALYQGFERDRLVLLAHRGTLSASSFGFPCPSNRQHLKLRMQVRSLFSGKHDFFPRPL